jgi:hypothetical protein
MERLVIADAPRSRHAFAMKIPRDGGQAFAIQVVRFWLAENGKLLLFLVGLTGITILGLLWLSRQYAVPGVYEEAEVVRFGGVAGEEGDRLLIVVRIRDGSLRTLRANPQDVVHCHVESRIRLVRHGAAFAVSGAACISGH